MPDPTLRNPHEPDGFKTSSVTRFLYIKTCVAVKIGAETVEVRDTKDANSPTLSFTHAEWDAFIKGVKLNEFDLVSAETLNLVAA